MSLQALLVMATFTAPEQLGTNPQSILWLLPLVAAIAVIYKATKMTTITTGLFAKEVAILFASIVVFIFITALVLYALVWLIAL
ncbi:MAG: hypothetical protein ACYSR9_00435 [Planctomycetota bacterium]|jgi:hypothetical protein